MASSRLSLPINIHYLSLFVRLGLLFGFTGIGRFRIAFALLIVTPLAVLAQLLSACDTHKSPLFRRARRRGPCSSSIQFLTCPSPQQTSVQPQCYKSIPIIHCTVTDESQDSFLFPTSIMLVTNTMIVPAGSALHSYSFTMSA